MKTYPPFAALNPLFQTVPPADLEAMAAGGSLRRYSRGSMLAHAGDIWPYLFVILSGKIRAYKESSEGRSLLIGEMEPGEIFWGVAFFHPTVGMPVRLEATVDSQIFLWERERLIPFLVNNGGFAWELSRLMVMRMLRASDLVEGLAFQPVAGRVARFLLEQTGSGETPTSRDLTLDQMAAHIGTTREMVCRYLRSFSDGGMITITRTEYQVLDREGLTRLSTQVKG
jgi:CRP-like cAMP-binding protein